MVRFRSLSTGIIALISLQLLDAEELKAIHGQTGTLVLDIQGQVLSATSELCGNAGEIAAETIYSMLQDSNCVLDTSQKEELERMIIKFPTYEYVVTLDAEQIYIVKRSSTSQD
ncbi:hypothetical protein PsorP6_009550 [Peronosclerospora sorghi]|uniref:Uncharacterized protein n=1 Tax=Peronosclerospora sorghi TaxID=230839 RepID=A0ACC0W0L4_9STRA|nr:hypothetical protein PsorP6_009550 [Peronosclerospora sorghi]